MAIKKSIHGDLRVVERLDDGEWKEIDFLKLERGDTFRMWEDDRKRIPVRTLSGATIFKAESFARPNHQNYGEIMITDMNAPGKTIIEA